MARWIKSDGTEVTLTPAGKKWTLAELQKAVGGYIEYMPGVPFKMVVNEEGRIRNFPLNVQATVLVRKALLKTGRPLCYLPEIYGDVLVLEKGEK